MYRICLDGEEVGNTLLELGDPPMGVVCGKISFRPSVSPFHLIFDYCQTHGITLNGADPEHEWIDTPIISGLRVFREDGVEICGQGCCLTGFKDDGYEITILGVPYPFYGEEFPHHRQAYDEQFKA